MSMIIAMITQKQIEEKEDKLLWLILRMLLFATEVCVMVFALLSGHLAEAKSSVKRTVIAFVIGSLAFTLLQTILEMKTLQSNSTEHYAFYYKVIILPEIFCSYATLNISHHKLRFTHFL